MVNGIVEVASQGSATCLQVLDADCDSFVERHPEEAHAVADFAGGVLDTNPITTALPLDFEGHGVDSSSGWFHAGRWSMVAAETALGFSSAPAAAFNTTSGVFYALSVCVNIREGGCGGAVFSVMVGLLGLAGHQSFLDEAFIVHMFNAIGNFMLAVPWSDC